MEEKSKMDEQQLQHFYHEHPLMFKEQYDGPPVSCEACEDPVLGPHYSCNQCSNKFILHKSCAQLPREILQHPLHSKHPLTLATKSSRGARFQCDACGAIFHCFSYRCDLCNFDLDVKCAFDFRNIDCIEHFSHEHLLNYIEKPTEGGSPIFCIGCLEPVLGPSYTCKISSRFGRKRSCSLFLHKSCAELPLQIQHPMHRQHLLTLNLNATREYHCDACDQDCSCRFTYSCFKCDFNLDLKCASAKGFVHFSHNHPLMFKKQGDKKKESGSLVICDGCQDPVLGPSYTCINTYRRRKCCFNLHKSCAELPRQIQHLVHRQHPLFLLNTIQNIKVRCLCNACNQPCTYRYSCSICDFNLDLKCATDWQKIIENESHEHQFTVPRNQIHLICDICGEFRTGTAYYFCSMCQLLVHKECASFPCDTKIPGHQHRLKLTWFLEDIYPKDQVCKICSINIDKCRTVYYCQECCRYVAHTTCVAVEYFQKEENQARTINIYDDYESDDAGEIKHFSHQHLLVANDHRQEVKDDRILTCEGCIC